MTYETVLDNARLVLADEVIDGHLVLRGGRIHAVGQGRVSQPAAIDCDGDLLLPGLVELHTDNLEKHLLPRPGAFWPADAAVVAHDAQLLASGITTALDALSVGDDAEESPLDPVVTVQALERAHRAGRLRVDHHLHLRCELPCPDLPARLEPLLEQPRLRLLSLMDHTPGQRQFRDLERYRAYSSRHGVAWDEAGFAARLERLRAQQHAYATPHRAYVLTQALARGVRVASHDDADATHVEQALACNASIAEFPVTLEAARAAHAAGLHVLAGAPNLVRGGSHSGNVAVAELAAQGTLSLLSSDYVPASLLHAVFLLARLPGWTLAAAVATASATPARAVGFDDRGVLAAGRRADVLRVHASGPVPVVQGVWISGVPRY
ncbi:alpha-D-ribose 1-methylphosphonate 5-triphosphate diphosphatase [Lysobacter tyrosinilyticus]